MNNIRRAIATFSIVAILSSFVVSTASAVTFNDVPAGLYYSDAVEEMTDLGVFDGTVDDFNPSVNMTRGLTAKLAVLAAGWAVEDVAEPSFLDVPKTHPQYEYIETAAALGFVNGYGGELTGYYGPDDPVDRAGYSKIIDLAFELPLLNPETSPFPDVSKTAWYYKEVATAAANGIVEGYKNGNFGPGDFINRADASVMGTRAQDAEVGAEGEGEGEEEAAEGEGEAGGLEVSLSDDNPAKATLPSKATNVKMVKWDFTATDGDAILKNLQIHRFGIGTLPSAHKVYIYNGYDRLTSAKTINSTTNLATFNNLNIDVDDGDTVTLTLVFEVGDNSASSTGEVGFEIADVDAVTSDAEVAGDFPVAGEIFTYSTVNAGEVTVTKNGTVVNAKVGEKDVTIAKINIQADTEAAEITEIGFYVGGTITSADLENFELYASGTDEPIATVAAVNAKDVAHMILDESYLIAKGDSRNFYLKADLNTGRSDDTILVYVDETTDVVAIGDKYGFGMSVVATAYDGTVCTAAVPTECSAMTLEGGDITLSGETISNRNIAVNQKDVAILKFTITAQTYVTFDSFAMHLIATETAADATAGLISDATGTPANFTDIKIKEVDGDHVWGPIDADSLVTAIGGTTATAEATDTAAAYYVFTDDLVMEQGESKDFELTLDVANNTTLGNETITAYVDIEASYPSLKDVNSKTLTNSSSLVPTSDYAGDAFTVKSNSLTVVKNESVGSSTQVVGTDDAELLALSVGAGDASAVTVTQLNFAGYVKDGGGGTALLGGDPDTTTPNVSFNEVVLGMNIYEGSIAEENKINATAGAATSAGIIIFDNLSWEIPAGETVTLIVTGNLANNATYDADIVKVDIATPATDITAEDDDGSSITCNSGTAPNTAGTHTTGSVITLSSGGTLAVDIPSNSPPSEIVVAGTDANDFAKIKFTSTLESFSVGKLSLMNNGSAYDDNLEALNVRYYTDEAQTVEETKTCAASATAGIYTCTGLNMMVPNPNLVGVPDYAVLSIEADLNGVANDLADEGDKPGFTLTIGYGQDFEATGESSGLKIYEQTLSLTDLTSSSNVTVETSALVMTADATATGTSLLVDDGSGDNITAGEILAGDVLCINAEDASDCATGTDELVYVSAVALNTVNAGAGADYDTLTIVRGYAGSTAAAYVNNEYIYMVHTGVDRAATSSLTVSTAGTPVLVAAAITTTTGTTLTVDGGSALTTLGTGDIICLAADASGVCAATDEFVYVSAVTAATTLTIVRGWAGGAVATTGSIEDNDEIYIIRKASNALGTNYMQVQATDLELEESASSRTGSTSDAEAILTFSATANAAKDAKIRQGVGYATATEGTDTGGVFGVAASTTATQHVDGSSMKVTWTGAGATASTIQYAASGLQNYSRVSFWVKYVDSGTDALDISALELFTSTGITVAAGQSLAVGDTYVTSDPAEDVWTFVDMIMPAGTAAEDDVIGFEINANTLAAGGATASGDWIAFDDLRVYNEKINVDLTINESWLAVTPTLAYLKQNGSVVATTYVDFDQAAANKTGQIQFVPIGTYADIEIGGTDTFVVEMDTATAISDDSTATEKLTAKIDLGNVITASDVYWYDGSSILNFLGVNSTDKISTVTNY